MPTAEQLVQEIRGAQGNHARDLKEQLWLTCLEMISALARKYTSQSPDLREDFISEGYLKFEHVLAAYDPNRGVPFRAYLSGCVERHFHDKVRKKSALPVAAITDRPGDDDLLTQLRNQEISDRVEEVLNSLLPRDKQRLRKLRAFRLRHFDGWSLEEAAQELGARTPNMVAQWVHRVRKAFLEEFPRRYPEYFDSTDTGEGLVLEAK
jgi:RNA polymerase sigma factor (sigma-70 family)